MSYGHGDAKGLGNVEVEVLGTPNGPPKFQEYGENFDLAFGS